MVTRPRHWALSRSIWTYSTSLHYWDMNQGSLVPVVPWGYRLRFWRISHLPYTFYLPISHHLRNNIRWLHRLVSVCVGLWDNQLRGLHTELCATSGVDLQMATSPTRACVFVSSYVTRVPHFPPILAGCNNNRCYSFIPIIRPQLWMSIFCLKWRHAEVCMNRKTYSLAGTVHWNITGQILLK